MTVDYHSGLDLAVFRAINSDGGRILDVAFLTLSARWFGILAGAALVAFLAIRGGRRRLALLVGFAVAVVLSDFVGAQALKPLLGRMRPCYALPAGSFRWIGGASDVGSLPSLHASNFFAMAGIAWAASRRAGLVAVVVAALVALSRVYLGVHWPTDVLAGAGWGLACAWVGLTAGRSLARRLAAARRPANATDLERILARVRDWAKGEEDVRAILLVGSHARRQARPDSDVDLVILAGQPDRFLSDPSFAGLLGRVERTSTEDWGRVTSLRAWYDDGLEVEFGFSTPDWIAEVPLDPGTARTLADGAVVVLDRMGGLEQLVATAARGRR